jgi:radical SAM superfamily enzyme YgiQ (UPF0313 family)
MSLLALKSYLQTAGMSVVAVDANIEALHFATEPDRCRRHIEPAIERLGRGLPEQMNRAIDPTRWMDRHTPPPALDAARAEEVLRRLPDLWTDDGFVLSRDRFKSELAVINDALILATVRMHPEPITIWRHDVHRFDPKVHNPYLDYLRERLIPEVKAQAPGIIGISFTYTEQLLYSLYLVEQFRHICPDATIVIGGAYFTEACKVIMVEDGPTIQYGTEKLQKWPYNFVHGLLTGMDGDLSTSAGMPIGIRGEGEKALIDIWRCRQRNEDPRDLPGAVHFDTDRRVLTCNDQDPPLAKEELPLLDLSGFPIGKKYLTPVPLAPIIAARGCYWDKCTFCGRARAIGIRCRQMSVDQVAQTITSYVQEFGVELLLFCDEAMTPGMLKGLTNRFSGSGLRFQFGSLFRYEKSLLPLIEPAFRCGLEYMSFGLESVNPRVLKKMNKGVHPDAIEAIMVECKRVGVRVNLNVIFGFPTETPEEADETMAFLERWADDIWSLGALPFYLDPASYIWFHPDQFGIRAKPGQKLGTDPSTYTLERGIDSHQAFEYLKRAKSHPALGLKFRNRGSEDYFGVLGALERLGGAERTAGGP